MQEAEEAVARQTDRFQFEWRLSSNNRFTLLFERIRQLPSDALKDSEWKFCNFSRFKREKRRDEHIKILAELVREPSESLGMMPLLDEVPYCLSFGISENRIRPNG